MRGRKAALVENGPVEGLWDLPVGWVWRAIDAVAPVNPRRDFQPIPDDAELTFVGMAAVSEISGRIDVSVTRPIGEVRSGYTKFATGDVIFAKITPCMENGKIAIIPELPFGLGAGSTEFHVLEPREVISEYLFHWLSQQWFRDVAEANMTGTAGQKRVPTGFIRSAAIPVPPLDIQHRIVARIDALFSEIEEGQVLLEKMGLAGQYAGLVGDLRQSILGAAFKGELS